MFKKRRNPWDDSFWMAHPHWYPEGKTLRESIPPEVIGYLIAAFGAFILGLMVGYALGVGL